MNNFWQIIVKFISQSICFKWPTCYHGYKWRFYKKAETRYFYKHILSLVFVRTTLNRVLNLVGPGWLLPNSEYYMPYSEVNTHVICITKFTRQYLIDEYKIPADKVELIYQGTEVDRFTSTPESKLEAVKRYPLTENAGPVLGSIGAIENRKGQIILLQAVKRLLDNGKLPNIQVMFVGEGPDEAMLKAVTKVYGLEEYVSFFPFTSEPNFVFDRIDILAFPSLYKEGLPNVLLEAMSMKVPVISTTLAGIPEVVFDGETGFLTDPGNVEQFSDAIEKVWANAETCQQMGNKARQLMQDEMDKKNQFEAFRQFFNAQ